MEEVLASHVPRVRRDDVRARGESAVLVPVYDDGGVAHVILTRRAAHLRSHTHQVAFPGGRVDPTDRDHWHAALREAHEEIALDPALPRRIGGLDRFVTVTSDSLIHPEVAALPGKPDVEASPAEVEHILFVSLAELLSPEAWREELWDFGGNERPVTFFELHGDTVWGATAAILREFLGLVTGVDQSTREVPT